MLSPGSIFISYRRSDSIAETGRLYDHLESHFGRNRVFKDVDSIPLGVNFRQYLDQEVGGCQVFVAVIGPKWLTVIGDDGARRIDSPTDWVRLEIESALRRKIPIIPLLVNGARMPKAAELPGELKALPDWQSALIRHDPDFRRDVNKLIQGIESLLRVTEIASESIAEGALSPKAPSLDPKSSLPIFSFEVVTVDERGEERSRQKKKAEYVREDLGNGVTFDMVMIPAGRFQMGSPAGEGGDSEHPRHPVTVDSFWMGMYPVTQAQWRVVAGFPKVDQDLEPDLSNFNNHPVESVNWYDAIEFCKRLSKKTGQEYRLPSEAEWEYACRAGTTTPFHFGPTLTTDLANYKGADAYGSGPKGETRGQTTPVGSFKAANGFGLYDMHGNVGEWCLDHWHENYQGAPSNGSVWLSSSETENRILRGGSWDNAPKNCRSASRFKVAPDYRNDFFGFRVCYSALRSLQ